MMGERETKGRGFAFAALDRTAAVSACMSLRVCAALGPGRDSFRRTLFEGLDTLVSQISDTPRTGRFAGTDETLLVHGLVCLQCEADKVKERVRASEAAPYAARNPSASGWQSLMRANRLASRATTSEVLHVHESCTESSSYSCKV